MSFPLFDTLLSECSDKSFIEKDLTLTQKKSMIKIIESLNKDGIELIYVLICCFYNKFEDYSIKKEYTVNDIYNCKITNNDIKFDLDILPIRLKHILFKFVDIHKKKMIDDDLNICIDKIQKL
jgi:hypothetical protein